jgi:hypothetical protein
VVDYQGPQWLSDFCQRHQIAIFNRVVEIQAESVSAEEAGLNANTVSALRYISKIQINNRGFVDKHESSLATLAESIPDCRLEELKETATVANGVSYPKEVIARIGSLSCSAKPVKPSVVALD